MTQTVNEGILDKLRKVRAMTQSPNEHEAQVAMGMMQKLLIEHNLSMAQIAEAEERDPLAEYTNASLSFDRKGGTDWKRELVFALARGNFCRAVVWTTRSGASSRTFDIVGKAVNIQAVKDMFEWLEVELLREAVRQAEIREDRWTPSATWKDSFLRGAVSAIDVRLREQIGMFKREERTSNALIVLDTELKEAFKQRHPKTGTASLAPLAFSRAGYNSGVEHGRQTNLGGERKLNPGGRLLIGQ